MMLTTLALVLAGVTQSAVSPSIAVPADNDVIRIVAAQFGSSGLAPVAGDPRPPRYAAPRA